MSASNRNTTTNGTKPQITQSQTQNTTSDGTTPGKPLLNKLDPTSDGTNPEKTDTKLNPLELKELKWFRPIELFVGAIFIPVIVGLASWHLSKSQFDTQQIDNKHTILKEYIDGISSLNLDKDLTQDEKEVKKRDKKIEDTFKQPLKTKIDSTKAQLEVLQSIKTAKDLLDTSKDARTMAIGQTQTALRRLDGEYKGYLIRFLYDSNLIKNKIAVEKNDDKNQEDPFTYKPVILLNGANIDDVKLQDAWLWKIQLQEAYLRKADFSNANLKEANLQGANLQDADLQDADLQGADLQGANLQGVKNLTLKQVTSAKNWQQACYDEKPNEGLGLTKEERQKNCEKFPKTSLMWPLF